MAKKDNSGNSLLEKLIFPLILGIALAGTAPWWITAIGNLFGNADSPTPAPSPTIAPTPDPTPTPEPPNPTPDPTPALTSQEIRKQGYIFRVESCRTTGEVGAVVCDFLVEAESERMDLSLQGRNTSIVDPTGQSYSASRMDFGRGGSNSGRSDLNPGVPILGSVSFDGVSSEVATFASFELGGYSYGDGNLTVTFYQVPLVN